MARYAASDGDTQGTSDRSRGTIFVNGSVSHPLRCDSEGRQQQKALIIAFKRQHRDADFCQCYRHLLHKEYEVSV